MPEQLPVTGAPGRAVLAVVDRAVESQWDAARRGALRTPGTVADKVDAISRRYVRELAAIGAAAGGTAAVPGVGTATAFGAVAIEVGAFAYRATEMILAIGAAHGHLDAEVEERRSWVLAILTHGDNAAAELAGLASVGVGGGGGAAGMTLESARTASAGWIQQANSYLGRKFIARLGARRGVAVVGKVLPFGIGAAFGAGTNYAVARRLARHADRFFAEVDQSMMTASRSSTG